METESEKVYRLILEHLDAFKNIRLLPPTEGIESSYIIKLRRGLEDECSDVLYGLFHNARVARDKGYPIPVEFTHFMIDYFTMRFDEDEDNNSKVAIDAFRRAYRFNPEKREWPIRDRVHYNMTYDDIIIGYVDGCQETASDEERKNASNQIYRYSFKHFEMGQYVNLKSLLESAPMNPKEYGRLLGLRREKLKIQDVSAFFNVSLMAKEYQTNPEFKRMWDSGEDCSKKTYVHNALKTYGVSERLKEFIAPLNRK
ncbi:hypothetical protein [Vibrio diazotrophicus]|uniref:hypothetical protein n=1 Tax=Vibrio diazotrophicus TaxID=685 RepID=UPI0005A6DE25|nr:hypothetical protein [Vibrio diazotrophicus]